MGKRTVKETPSSIRDGESLTVNPAPEPNEDVPAAALPSLETLLDVLGIAWDDFKRRLDMLQSHNPQIPLTAEQVADVLVNLVTRAHLRQVFLRAGQLVVETAKAGHGENTTDPSASA